MSDLSQWSELGQAIGGIARGADVPPELLEYVRRYYKRLHVWLLRHEPCFEHYGSEGEWVPRKALKESVVLERLRDEPYRKARPAENPA